MTFLELLADESSWLTKEDGAIGLCKEFQFEDNFTPWNFFHQLIRSLEDYTKIQEENIELKRELEKRKNG